MKFVLIMARSYLGFRYRRTKAELTRSRIRRRQWRRTKLGRQHFRGDGTVPNQAATPSGGTISIRSGWLRHLLRRQQVSIGGRILTANGIGITMQRSF